MVLQTQINYYMTISPHPETIPIQSKPIPSTYSLRCNIRFRRQFFFNFRWISWTAVKIVFIQIWPMTFRICSLCSQLTIGRNLHKMETHFKQSVSWQMGLLKSNLPDIVSDCLKSVNIVKSVNLVNSFNSIMNILRYFF